MNMEEKAREAAIVWYEREVRLPFEPDTEEEDTEQRTAAMYPFIQGYRAGHRESLPEALAVALKHMKNKENTDGHRAGALAIAAEIEELIK